MARKKRQKQPNGAGNVRQRSDGRWMARVWLEDAITGERKRFAYYGGTEQEARAKMEDAKVAVRRGDTLAAGDKPTLKTYGEHWLKVRTDAPDARPRVVRRYKEILEYHVFPTLGRVKLAELDASQIRDLMRAKREGKGAAKPLSPRTCNHIRAVLRAMLNDAMTETVRGRNRYGLTVNVAAGRKLTMPIPTTKGPRAFDVDQSLKVLELAKAHPEGAIWTVALMTGMRQSEILGLRWSDVNDLDDCGNASVTIRQTVQREKGRWLVQPPKTEASAGEVPLVSIACQALQRQRSTQREQRLRVGKRWKPERDQAGRPIDELVFTTSTGAPRHGTVITHRFAEAVKDAGLPDVDFHGLRHSTGSLLARLNTPPKVIQEILRHADIHTTMQLYVEGTDVDRREALAALNARFSG